MLKKDFAMVENAVAGGDSASWVLHAAIKSIKV